MYAKLLESGQLQIAPKKLPGDGVTVWNPPDAMYRAAGWKPVEFVEAPEAPEGFYYEPGWEERADRIIQTWTLVQEPDDIDEAEAFDIIFGGGAE